MLKLAGEGLYRERLETIAYSPGLKDTGDLEAGTHTIVPTSRPATGSAQYSAQLTLTAPPDARLAILRLATRLSVNIVSLGTATHVYCSVRVDVDDAGHELFSEDWTSTGAKLDAVDTHSGNKVTIFNSLKDGAAHTFYFLFWADAASQAQIDVVELWEGVGTSVIASGAAPLEVVHTGWMALAANLVRVGTGTLSHALFNGSSGASTYVKTYTATGYITMHESQTMYPGKVTVGLLGTVATDLNYLSAMTAVLRSEQ